MLQLFCKEERECKLCCAVNVAAGQEVSRKIKTLLAYVIAGGIRVEDLKFSRLQQLRQATAETGETDRNCCLLKTREKEKMYKMITKEKIRLSAIYNGDQLVYFEHLLPQIWQHADENCKLRQFTTWESAPEK